MKNKWWDVDSKGVLTINADKYINENGHGVLPKIGERLWLFEQSLKNIKKIVFTKKGLEFPKNATNWFNGYENVTEIEGLELVSTKNVTAMRYMFANMQSLTELDLSSFDTNNVTDMSHMFYANLAYETNKVKFRNNIDFTKEIEEKTKPNYYKLKTIEVFDFIDEFELNFNIGKVAKYIARYKNKNGLEDLEKAQVYLNREIKKLKKELE